MHLLRFGKKAETRGAVYGNYSERTLKRRTRELDSALSSPIPPDEFLISPDEVLFFIRTMNEPNRITTTIQPRESIYTGTWLEQAGGSCTVLSIANAKRANLQLNLMEESQHTELLRLYTFSRDRRKPGGEGIGALDLARIGSNPETSFKVVNIATAEAIDWETTYNRRNGAVVRQKLIDKNVKAIADAIDNNKGMILPLDYKKYKGEFKGRRSRNFRKHNVALVGYKINDKGKINVQVIDPDRGILWMSLDHILRSLAFPAFIEISHNHKN